MKFFHFNKSLGYIVATVLGVCSLCACYFFIYLPANEKLIEEQRFRTLQNIDKNIHEKMENSVSQINGIISATRAKDPVKYAENYSRENFILAVEKDPIAYANKRSDMPDSLVETKVNDIANQVIITLKKRSKEQAAVLTGSIKFSLKQFVEYLLPEEVFDGYVILFRGKTVFESFPSGINNLQEDSLFKLNKGLGGSVIRKVNSGGIEYKLFLHEANLGGDNSLILGGLLSNNRYYKERSQLPAGIVMLLIILVLAIIVIFPWIKLYQMGSKDRLTLVDGASIILVSMILMSLLSLCFFKYFTGIRKSDSPDSKKVLAAQINNAFNNEIEKIYGVLHNYDKVRYDQKITRNIVHLNSAKIKYGDDQATGNPNVLVNNHAGSKNIKQVFWLDSTGKEMYNWTNESQNAPLGNFSTRNYFTSLRDNNEYNLYGDSSCPYFLDQVVSRTTGIFTSVISRKSIDPKGYLVATTFTMGSVDKTILPAGYSFAIIDNSGKVLYHSIKTRNLNENVKAEFSDSANVANCISSRLTREFITSYYSKTYSVLVTPMPNLPYSIIIFSDKSYQETRDIEVYSFTFSMLLLLFIYLVLQLGLTFLFSARRSFFKKQLFDTSWIGPKNSRNKDYLLCSLFNSVIIGMLIHNFPGTTFLQFLFLLLSEMIFISLFMNILLAIRYKKENKSNNLRYKLYAIYWLAALLFICIAVAFCRLDDNRYSIIFLTLKSLVVGGMLLLISLFSPTKIKSYFSTRVKYTHSFAFMILTTLIITSGIPVAFFYTSSYNYEQNLAVRYRQTDYANRLLTIPNLGAVLKNGTATCNANGIYYDGAYIRKLPTYISHEEINGRNNSLSTEEKRSLQLLGRFRILINDKAVNTNKLSLLSTSDNSIIYFPEFFNTATDTGAHTYRQTADIEKYLDILSFDLKYKVPDLWNSENILSYWIWLLVALFIFFFVLLNIIKKLFCLNIPDLEIWKQLDDKILTDNKLNDLLFVIGLPGAGKVKRILKKIEKNIINCDGTKLIYNKNNKEDNNVLLADLINIPDKGAEIGQDENWLEFMEETIDPKYKVIIFNHFEYNIQDDFTNRAKLDMLEQVMLKGHCKIIILSTIHPVNFLDSLNEHNRTANGPAKKEDAGTRSGHDLERWHVLLGHYRIVIMPILEEGVNDETARKYLLRSETSYTHFLHDMQKITLDIADEIEDKNSEVKTDKLAYKLQISAHYFYMYIWQSLTKEEKFLLYDLAEDNLVNSYDDYNLTMLIAKGVILNNTGSLRLFNRGFRNFILTAIGNSEAMKIKDRIRENGNWGNLRTPLMIIIVAILAFLLISQQESYSKLLTYIAALAAGVPVVLKIFSLFDRSATKTGS